MDNQPPVRSFCITTTQVTTTRVTISPTGETISSGSTSPGCEASTLNYLRNYRQQHQRAVPSLSGHHRITELDSVEANTSSNTGGAWIKQEPQLDNNVQQENQKRVSVICATRTKAQSPRRETVDSDEEISSNGCIPTPTPQTPGPQSPQSPSSNTIDCPICSALAIDHLHYGGLACFSCKAFFRRIVVTQSKKSKRCRRGDGKCILTLGKRNNCPPCRFQRCLDSGMKPSLVVSGKAIKHGDKAVVKAEDNQTKVKSETSIAVTNRITDNEKLSQILQYHRLIISQTAGVNLLKIPTKFLTQIQQRVNTETSEASEIQDDILSMAKLELAFLIAKDCVVFFTENFSIDQLLVSQIEGICPALIFTSVQEFFVQLVVYFLKNCPHFQSLTWACQARLLRKNIADVSVLLMTMCFEKNLQVFR